MKKTDKINIKSRKGASLIILAFSALAIAGLASFALDLGIILNQRYEFQKAVESAALISASEMEIYELGGVFRVPTQNQISNIATNNYDALAKHNQLMREVASAPTITVNRTSKAVKVEADTTVPTYFFNLLGVSKVNIQAKAAAVNVPTYLSGTFPKPTGSVLNGIGTYRDTEIMQPLGGDNSGAGESTTNIFNVNANYAYIYGMPDGRALSLGPGGHITIKLPSVIVDGKGSDFVIYERGHAEGYFVYAGIDNNPANPYSDASSPGNDIKWVNISCTGIPLYANKSVLLGAHETSVTIGGGVITDYKFYGSGMFDLGAQCRDGAGTLIYDGTGVVPGVPSISNVKYLKIIDDNSEDGFFIQPRFGINNTVGIPTLLPGEHSSITPGADLDAIGIFHHSRLVRVADFDSGDTDGDGLLDVLERMVGLDMNNADTDGDGIDDPVEYLGYSPVSPPIDAADTIESAGSATILYKDYPATTLAPPVMAVDSP